MTGAFILVAFIGLIIFLAIMLAIFSEKEYIIFDYNQYKIKYSIYGDSYKVELILNKQVLEIAYFDVEYKTKEYVAEKIIEIYKNNKNLIRPLPRYNMSSSKLG